MNQGNEVGRAGIGAAMISLGIYTFVVGRNTLIPAMAVAVHSPHELPPLLMGALGCCALLLAAGALLLYVGLTKSIGERDLILAGKALLGGLIAAGLLIYGAYVPDWPLLNLCLKGAYIACIPRSAIRVYLALRAMPDTQLPDPQDVDDMPISGPATPEEAHEGLAG